MQALFWHFKTSHQSGCKRKFGAVLAEAEAEDGVQQGWRMVAGRASVNSPATTPSIAGTGWVDTARDQRASGLVFQAEAAHYAPTITISDFVFEGVTVLDLPVVALHDLDLPVASMKDIYGQLFVEAEPTTGSPLTYYNHVFPTHLVVADLVRRRRDPFTEVLETKVREAHATIVEWQMRQHAQPALVQRLHELVASARDEYPETEIPNRRVLESALSFFRARRELQTPMFAVTSQGGVWAEWRGEQGRSAALEFVRNGSVNLAAFFPDPEQPLATGALSGVFTWKSAAKAVHSTETLRWMRTGHG
jgi:hypothetical protein